MKFTYRSKGTADDWTTETINASSREEAVLKLDEIYGIERDDEGEQTNQHVIKVEVLEES